MHVLPAMQRGSAQATYLSGSEANYMMHAYITCKIGIIRVAGDVCSQLGMCLGRLVIM